MAVLYGEWFSNLTLPQLPTATDFGAAPFLSIQKGRVSGLAVKAGSSGGRSKDSSQRCFCLGQSKGKH